MSGIEKTVIKEIVARSFERYAKAIARNELAEEFEKASRELGFEFPSDEISELMKTEGAHILCGFDREYDDPVVAACGVFKVMRKTQAL